MCFLDRLRDGWIGKVSGDMTGSFYDLCRVGLLLLFFTLGRRCIIPSGESLAFSLALNGVKGWVGMQKSKRFHELLDLIYFVN